MVYKMQLYLIYLTESNYSKKMCNIVNLYYLHNLIKTIKNDN